jgi:translation initiation factor 2 alpha subunit (eIF-2alpha)
MRDQEIKDLSTILELYENLSAKRKCTEDEQDNLDMTEYILLKSVKPLLEEVRKLKSEENKPMDEFINAGIELVWSLQYLIRFLPKECKEAYEKFKEACTKELEKKFSASKGRAKSWRRLNVNRSVSASD